MQRVSKDQIKVSFNSPVEKESREYKDSFPDDFPTIEKIKQEYGTIVWCQYTKCYHNKAIEGLQRTTGTILKNRSYNPLNEQEHIWGNVCTRGEVAIKFDSIITATGAKLNVPSCFTSSIKKTGYMNWSNLLQSDGSPLGGNIESQNTLNSGY